MHPPFHFVLEVILWTGDTGPWPKVAVTAIFALLARWMRGVTSSGALAGAFVCFLLLLGGGWGAFAALIAVFGLTWSTTRLGYQRKQKLGTAEKKVGRKASQVLANLSVAAVCAGLCPIVHKQVLLVAAVAALSEAAADTVSSEVGQAVSDKARLITTWQEVVAGTDGAISLAGTCAGVAAAVVVGLVCVFTGMFSLRLYVCSTVAAIFGTITDSILGAWLERKHILNNDAVNFLSTLVAAVAAAALFEF